MSEAIMFIGDLEDFVRHLCRNEIFALQEYDIGMMVARWSDDDRGRFLKNAKADVGKARRRIRSTVAQPAQRERAMKIFEDAVEGERALMKKEAAHLKDVRI